MKKTPATSFLYKPHVQEVSISSHGGNILQYGYKSGIIDFSANINPTGLSKKAVKILKDLGRLKYFTENITQS